MYSQSLSPSFYIALQNVGDLFLVRMFNLWLFDLLEAGWLSPGWALSGGVAWGTQGDANKGVGKDYQHPCDRPLRHSVGVLCEREPFINVSIKTWSRLLLCLLTPPLAIVNNGPAALPVLIIIRMLIMCMLFYYGSWINFTVLFSRTRSHKVAGVRDDSLCGHFCNHSRGARRKTRSERRLSCFHCRELSPSPESLIHQHSMISSFFLIDFFGGALRSRGTPKQAGEDKLFSKSKSFC